MQRRIVRVLALLSASAIAVAACRGDASPPGDLDSCEPGVRTETRPNVVVFLTDDQTTEQMRVMPQTLELLGAQGLTFANMVVNDSDCCPSRATLLTGQQSRHHGVVWNTPPTGGFAAFEDQDTTLPVALQNVGYQTGWVGKYLNRFGERIPQDRYVPPGWTDFRGLIWPAEALFYEAAFFDNGDVVETGPDDYVTHEITARAIDMVNRFADSGDPFFLVIGHVAPHSPGGIPLADVDEGDLLGQFAALPEIEPAIPEPAYAGRFAEEALPGGPSFNEVDVSDKSRINQRRRMDDEMIELVGSLYRGALESLLSVDDSVAAVVAELERTCTLDDTYVLYTSDNGYFYGEHRLPYGKYLPYRVSRSVPLLVRGPGVPAGAIARSVVSNVDLAPTIAELAGTSLMREADGISLVDWLERGPAADRGRAVYLEGHAPRDRTIIPFDAVFDGTMLYLEMSNGENEFYDLVSDPFELSNRAFDPRYVDDVARAVDLLEEFRECEGATCRSIGAGTSIPGAP